MAGRATVGYVADTSYNNTHAFFYDGTRMYDLGILPGLPYSSAHDINASDQVIGNAHNDGHSDTRGFLWQNGVMQDLTPPGATRSVAYGINDAGQVVGWAYFPGSPVSPDEFPEGAPAFLYDSTGFRLLGTLGGAWGRSSARAINNLGQVVGEGRSWGRGIVRIASSCTLGARCTT